MNVAVAFVYMRSRAHRHDDDEVLIVEPLELSYCIFVEIGSYIVWKLYILRLGRVIDVSLYWVYIEPCVLSRVYFYLSLWYVGWAPAR